MILVFFLVLITAVVGSAAMAGIIAYLMNRINKLEAGTADSGRLLAELEELKVQLEASEGSLARLEERMDFTEKLLGDGRDKEDAG